MKLRVGEVLGLSHLLQLEMNSNYLTSVNNNDFFNLQNLKYLGIYNNRFQFTSSEIIPFSTLTSLEDLDLTLSNFMNSIGKNSFKNLNSLKYIRTGLSNIQYLDFQVLNSTFCTINRIINIFMDGNHSLKYDNFIETKCLKFFK